MYRVEAAVDWAGAVAHAEMDRGTKFTLLVLRTLVPAFGTISVSTKKTLTTLLAKMTDLEEAQVDHRLERAQRMGWLTVQTDAKRKNWTLKLTFPAPAVVHVVNSHQDAVVIQAKTWEEAVEVALEVADDG